MAAGDFTTSAWRIRDGRDEDGPALIALIWSCWSAYPGIKMDVDREMPELHALATYYGDRNGRLWVAEADGRILGMVGVRPTAETVWEICRVYVDPGLHGSGMGHALLDTAERHAIVTGAKRLVLWSDTRFDRAHRFYEKRSFVRHGAVRVLDDISNSLEYAYAKPIDGIEVLDIAAAESAVTRLSDILIACVDDGASVSFLSPLCRDKARDFWQRRALDIGTGKRVMVAVWRDGVLVGIGMLDLATPENQRHRAEIQKVLVDPRARRRGIGRRIMRSLERIAAEHGRSVLTLDTGSGSDGEALYRAEGWVEAGRIPDFARDGRGTLHATVLFWKRLGTA